jgi:hypothetical protein
MDGAKDDISSIRRVDCGVSACGSEGKRVVHRKEEASSALVGMTANPCVVPIITVTDKAAAFLFSTNFGLGGQHNVRAVSGHTVKNVVFVVVQSACVESGENQSLDVRGNVVSIGRCVGGWCSAWRAVVGWRAAWMRMVCRVR